MGNELVRSRKYYIETFNIIYVFEDVNKFIEKSKLLDKAGIKHIVYTNDVLNNHKVSKFNHFRLLNLPKGSYVIV